VAVRVVECGVPAYYTGWSLPMPETAAPRLTSRPLLVTAAALALVLAGTILLWAHYGAAVFFETIRAGFVACFG
jgi:hypothetical protein